MLAKSHFVRKLFMIKLLPRPHVDVGFIFVRRSERCKNKIKNQKEKADRHPSNGHGTKCCGLNLWVGAYKILKQGDQIGSQHNRVETGQHQRYPKSHEDWKEPERPK